MRLNLTIGNCRKWKPLSDFAHKMNKNDLITLYKKRETEDQGEINWINYWKLNI